MFITLDKNILAECKQKKHYKKDVLSPRVNTVLNDNELMSCEGLLTEK